MKPKKSLGQNFLNEDKILNDIVKCGEITDNDIILEIGPGTGNLTEKILKKKPKKLIVVEKDKELCLNLLNKYGKNIDVVHDDILKCYNIFKNDRPIKVFGNLPYNISTKILISYIKLPNLKKDFSKFVFVFQKEVADRIIAKYNSAYFGRLSILTSWKMNCSKILDIPPRSFYPVPKVWSSLIVFNPKHKIEYLMKPKNLEHVTNIFFNQRRKMIKKPMKQLFSDYENVASRLNLDLSLRPQNLPVSKYIDICKIYEKLNK